MTVYSKIGNKSPASKPLKNFLKKSTQISKVNLKNLKIDTLKSNSKYWKRMKST